ncbi:MAG TPA: hypothetical protein VN894_00765, partial [Polyangiaceae bacterium]|nr:hypothetical protein [Polyangiaceae bacterium]
HGCSCRPFPAYKPGTGAAILSAVEPPVDLEAIAPAARKILDPSAPAPMRQMAARGVAPGLKPGDALTVVALLSESADAAIATIATATLRKLPAPVLNGALASDLPPGVLALIAPQYAANLAVMEKLLAHPRVPPHAVANVAALASESVAELVATNEQRLLAHPLIIEKLYMNKATRMSTADRVLELAVRNRVELKGIPAYKEAAAAIGQELIAEPSEEPTPDDVLFKETEAAASEAPVDPSVEDTHRLDESTGDEVVEDKFLPLHARLTKMTVSQKIRRAMLGSAAERLLLVRDSNRLVAQASVKSPSIQESEVVRISASRNVSEDVLRIIAQDREWTRSHQIKLNLTQNPRTPFAFAAKLIPHLREHELKALARSKNVTGAVAQAASQWLSRRNVKT